MAMKMKANGAVVEEEVPKKAARVAAAVYVQPRIEPRIVQVAPQCVPQELRPVEIHPALLAATPMKMKTTHPVLVTPPTSSTIGTTLTASTHATRIDYEAPPTTAEEALERAARAFALLEEMDRQEREQQEKQHQKEDFLLDDSNYDQVKLDDAELMRHELEEQEGSAYAPTPPAPGSPGPQRSDEPAYSIPTTMTEMTLTKTDGPAGVDDSATTGLTLTNKHGAADVDDPALLSMTVKEEAVTKNDNGVVNMDSTLKSNTEETAAVVGQNRVVARTRCFQASRPIAAMGQVPKKVVVVRVVRKTAAAVEQQRYGQPNQYHMMKHMQNAHMADAAIPAINDAGRGGMMLPPGFLVPPPPGASAKARGTNKKTQKKQRWGGCC